MPTYGALRLRLSQLAPGIALEMIDGWIQDRYTQMLDELPWKRLEGESVIQAPASYITGTVNANQGSNAITGVGTTWTPGMNGFMIRINNGSEYYQFMPSTATTATLDRPFEQLSATGLSYRIDQNIFLLPSNTRLVRQIRPLHDINHPLELVTTGDLNRLDAQRNQYGTPYYAAPTWDSAGTTPQLQLELYPVPQVPTSDGSLLSWVVDYIGEQPSLDPTQTSFALLPWTRPGCIVAGVEADAAIFKGDIPKATLKEARFEVLLAQMRRINTLQRGPEEMRLARELRRGPADRDRQNELRSLLGPGAWRDGWSG